MSGTQALSGDGFCAMQINLRQKMCAEVLRLLLSGKFEATCSDDSATTANVMPTSLASDGISTLPPPLLPAAVANPWHRGSVPARALLRASELLRRTCPNAHELVRNVGAAQMESLLDVDEAQLTIRLRGLAKTLGKLVQAYVISISAMEGEHVQGESPVEFDEVSELKSNQAPRGGLWAPVREPSSLQERLCELQRDLTEVEQQAGQCGAELGMPLTRVHRSRAPWMAGQHAAPRASSVAARYSRALSAARQLGSAGI
mmetsp:Transcript_85871/g.276201  ORF Transcript_85871/g.276201 Transcript_85871/m.276201 type:complete len:259 (-) Transcript_85871:782-1558(-)